MLNSCVHNADTIHTISTKVVWQLDPIHEASSAPQCQINSRSTHTYIHTPTTTMWILVCKHFDPITCAYVTCSEKIDQSDLFSVKELWVLA